MKISRRLGGQVRLRFDPGEAPALAAILDELVVLVTSGGTDDPALQRLFPAAYLDADQAAEFRELTAASLRDERVDRARACQAELAGQIDPSRPASVTVELDAAGATRWIQVINDVRLAMGTRLGITEDDDPATDDPADPAAEPRSIYYWLTWMQDGLVRTLMR